MRAKKIDSDVAEKLEKFIDISSHDFIRSLYKLTKEIRNEYQQDRLPYSWLYFFSLRRKFENEYRSLSTGEIAEIEGTNPRNIQYLKEKHYNILHSKESYLI
jgi:hypothetical protein